MPFRDGTGPTGQGPMTGRGLGPCGNNQSGAENNGNIGLGKGRGLGLGLGRRNAGRGRGFGRGFWSSWLGRNNRQN